MFLIQIILLLVATIILIMIVFEEHIQKRLSQDKGVLENLWFEEERRQSPRIDRKLDIVYNVPNQQGALKNCPSTDISKTGIQILLKEKLQKDIILSLEFEIPGLSKKKVSAKGQVVWSRENEKLKRDGIRRFDTGIKFLQITETDEKNLEEFVNGSLATSGRKAPKKK